MLSTAAAALIEAIGLGHPATVDLATLPPPWPSTVWPMWDATVNRRTTETRHSIGPGGFGLWSMAIRQQAGKAAISLLVDVSDPPGYPAAVNVGILAK